RRAIAQAEACLLAEFKTDGELNEQRRQSKYFAGAALAHRRYRRQGRAIEHRCYRLRQGRRDRGMTLDVVGKPREDDAARDALRQRRSERGHRPEGRLARMRAPFVRAEADPGELTIARGHAIDGEIRIAVDEPQERGPAFRHALERRVGEGHRLPLPCNTLVTVDRKVSP